MSILNLKPSLKENFRVASFDLDINSRLRISSLLGFLQEIAGRHAEHLDVGYEKLRNAGMVWMLSRIYVEIHKFPEWNDELEVETWPLGMVRLFFRRDFIITRGTEELIAVSSYWLLINLEKMRPCVIPINEDIIRHNAGRYSVEGEMGEIPPSSGKETREIDIVYSFLDRNRHVNNTRYADWVMDELGMAVFERAPSFFGIEYRRQITPKDKVLVRHSLLNGREDVFLVEGIIKDSGRSCFRAKVQF